MLKNSSKQSGTTPFEKEGSGSSVGTAFFLAFIASLSAAAILEVRKPRTVVLVVNPVDAEVGDAT